MNCTWEEIDEDDPDKGLFYRDAHGDLWRQVRCKCCKLVTNPTPHPFERIYSTCRCIGAGDRVANTLAFFGITKERVAWARGMFGAEGCGGCPEKQEALNEAGKKLGL